MIGNVSAPRLRRTLVATVLSLTLLGAVTACSSVEPTGDASSFAAVTGSAVPVADELTALCQQVVDQQLDAETGAAIAEGSGYTSRVVKIDGVDQPTTKDARDDRMNFEVQNDVIVACTVG